MTRPTLDRLVEEACNLRTEGMGRTELMVKLDEAHATAYLFACFNSQVCNGGFSQWVCNGYGLLARETAVILGYIGTENAMKAKVMVDKIATYLDFNATDEGYFGDYYLASDYEEQIEEEMAKFDDEYYEFNEALIGEVEEYLARKINGVNLNPVSN